MIYIIGAGGVGSWLTASLCKLVGPDDITVMDGDELETKNLDRQLFSDDDVGRNKAEALAEKYGCTGDTRWYSGSLVEHSMGDWLLVCVDNHPARKEAIEACDRAGCRAIFAANEVTSAEAYLYLPEWQGTKLDPRVYYPEIVESKAGDPRSRAAGCTGEAQQSNRQLVTANFMAAALLQHLYVLWAMEAPKMSKEVVPHLPHKLVSNLSKLETHKIKDTK